MGIIDDAIRSTQKMVQDPEFQADMAENAKKLMWNPSQSEFGTGKIPTEEALSQMSWLDLMALRSKLTSTADQNAVAPYEHRAYAREESANGAYPALQQAICSIGYTPVKAIIGGARSNPSFREIGQGLVGVLEGLAK